VSSTAPGQAENNSAFRACPERDSAGWWSLSTWHAHRQRQQVSSRRDRLAVRVMLPGLVGEGNACDQLDEAGVQRDGEGRVAND